MRLETMNLHDNISVYTAVPHDSHSYRNQSVSMLRSNYVYTCPFTRTLVGVEASVGLGDLHHTLG